MIPRELTNLKKGSRVFVVGAGGKTTLIHQLAEHYHKLGWRVLVTTTTHMLKEEGSLMEVYAIVHQLRETGYVFAGSPDPTNASKITALPEETIERLLRETDLMLVEADGARHMSFKVPYAWEPVILPVATHIVCGYARKALGHEIRQVCYNPEGVVSVLRTRFPEVEAQGATCLLTEEMLHFATEETYIKPLRAAYPGARVLAAAFDGNGEET